MASGEAVEATVTGKRKAVALTQLDDETSQRDDDELGHLRQPSSGTSGAHRGAKRQSAQISHPPPDDSVPVPCPRCESTCTKFCYYNNYDISQPRYYCKDCQRYWTRGGVLCDVPPGSGRRKSRAMAWKKKGGGSSSSQRSGQVTNAPAETPSTTAPDKPGPSLDTSALQPRCTGLTTSNPVAGMLLSNFGLLTEGGVPARPWQPASNGGQLSTDQLTLNSRAGHSTDNYNAPPQGLGLLDGPASRLPPYKSSYLGSVSALGSLGSGSPSLAHNTRTPSAPTSLPNIPQLSVDHASGPASWRAQQPPNSNGLSNHNHLFSKLPHLPPQDRQNLSSSDRIVSLAAQLSLSLGNGTPGPLPNDDAGARHLSRSAAPNSSALTPQGPPRSLPADGRGQSGSRQAELLASNTVRSSTAQHSGDAGARAGETPATKANLPSAFDGAKVNGGASTKELCSTSRAMPAGAPPTEASGNLAAMRDTATNSSRCATHSVAKPAAENGNGDDAVAAAMPAFLAALQKHMQDCTGKSPLTADTVASTYASMLQQLQTMDSSSLNTTGQQARNMLALMEAYPPQVQILVAQSAAWLYYLTIHSPEEPQPGAGKATPTLPQPLKVENGAAQALPSLPNGSAAASSLTYEPGPFNAPWQPLDGAKANGNFAFPRSLGFAAGDAAKLNSAANGANGLNGLHTSLPLRSDQGPDAGAGQGLLNQHGAHLPYYSLSTALNNSSALNDRGSVDLQASLQRALAQNGSSYAAYGAKCNGALLTGLHADSYGLQTTPSAFDVQAPFTGRLLPVLNVDGVLAGSALAGAHAPHNSGQ